MGKISYVGRSVTPEEYLGLREAVGWPPLDAALALRAFRYDLFSVVVELEGETVGCGRILGDGVLHFFVQDVLVHPRVQRRQVGTKIMEILLSWLGSATKPQSRVALLAAPGTVGFFARFGFSALPDDAPGMQLSDAGRLRAGNA